MIHLFNILLFTALCICDINGKVPQYIKELAQNNDNEHLECVLDSILKPRVVGTETHEEVATFIIKELKTLGFTTEIDRFIASTPLFGNLTFTNIIGKSNPDADEYIALACHYDSKYFENDTEFVGAIDSAVPCAIMLNVAKVLLPYLEEHNNRSDIGLMLIFFDGEEAFIDWNEVDSIYGSKHLAKKLSNNATPLRNGNRDVKDIDRIEVLVLLDLIGARGSKFYNFFQNTVGLHSSLVNIEQSLGKSRLLEGRNNIFIPRTQFAFIDDDHRPFIQRNVPVLHLITVPFPPQWHKSSDTAENLHWPSIRNFNKILRIFVYDYLRLHTPEVTFRNSGDFA